jgi:hypothetical protein
VALSRLKSLDSLKLLGLNELWLNAHPLVLRADVYFRDKSESVVTEYKAVDDDIFQEIHRHFIQIIGWRYVVEAVEIKKMLPSKPSRPRKPKVEKWATILQTLVLIQQHKTLKQIAKERGLTEGTILGHVFKIHTLYPDTPLAQFKPDSKLFNLVHKVVIALSKEQKSSDGLSTKAIFDFLGGEVSYEDIKRCLLFL